MSRWMIAASLLLLVALAALSAPAGAEVPKADWSACIKGDLNGQKIDPNQRIGACNRLLQNAETDPGDSGAILAARAAAHNDLRQYADSLKDIESALAQNTRADAWEFIYRVMGQAQYGLKNFAAAEVAFEQATGYPEADGWSWDRLGNARMQQGKYQAAERDYRKAAATNPAFAEMWSDIADSLFAQGRFAEAEPLYAKAIEIAKGESAWDSVFRYLAAFHQGSAAPADLHEEAAGWEAEENYLTFAGRLLAGAITEAQFRDGIAALAARDNAPQDGAFWASFTLGHRDLIAGADGTAGEYLRQAAATASMDAIYLNAAQFAK